MDMYAYDDMKIWHRCMSSVPLVVLDADPIVDERQALPAELACTQSNHKALRQKDAYLYDRYNQEVPPPLPFKAKDDIPSLSGLPDSGPNMGWVQMMSQSAGRFSSITLRGCT